MMLLGPDIMVSPQDMNSLQDYGAAAVGLQRRRQTAKAGVSVMGCSGPVMSSNKVLKIVEDRILLCA